PQSMSPSAGTPPPSPTAPLQLGPIGSSETSRRRAREAERRQVTALVCGCDLFESEAYLGLEAEDQAQILRAFQHACAQAVGQFDGTVVQCNERGLLACFGSPVAYEDAARRAAEAGLRLLHDLKALGGPPRQAPDLDAEPWVGLHTGPAIVEVKGDAVSLVGDVRNVAVRLKDVAAPGQVVCTEATHRLFRDQLPCAGPGAHKIKGVSRPITLLLVERAPPAGTRVARAPA